MPIIYPSSRRRKGPTPIANHSREDGWDRFLDVFGLEALNHKHSKDPDDQASNDGVETHVSVADSMEGSAKKKLELVDLPLETQKQIFSFSSHPDLIALSLVSKHMRDIASAHLYRSFHIVFPDDDDPANDYPIDSLASGLDTFVTSDYDYAAYLHEITLESLSTGLKGESAYRFYLYDASCGKFMNTLLLLTLRKAKALETFKWDIRVELSREVFKVLHRIQSLQHLHLRMQAGESIHQNAPPLPSSTTSTSAPPSPYLPTPPPLSHHNSIVFITPLPTSYSSSFALGSKATLKSHSKTSKSPSSSHQSPSTFSSFRNLKTLSVLDMDSHEYIEEIRTCLENSSSTLSTLKLSFSDGLANKARKPLPDIHSDDESDIEDEFGQLVPAPGVIDPNAPTKAFKAQEEKKNQEAALGKIFGAETPFSKLSIVTDTNSEKDFKNKDRGEDINAKHVKTFVNFYSRFMAQVKPGREDTTEVKEALGLIEKATQLYFDAVDLGNEEAAAAGVLGGIVTPSPAPSHTNAGNPNEAITSGPTVQDGPGLFDPPQTKQQPSITEPGVSNPDDIDIEVPESDDLTVEPEILPETFQSTAETFLPKASGTSSAANSSPVPQDPNMMMEPDKPSLPTLDTTAANAQQSYHKELIDVNWFTEVEAAIDKHKRSQYVRKTRGLTLKTLSLYLIPMKASVLSKAVDLTVLQNITLLSVGSQNNFWNHLEKENKQSLLPLRKIHTDNVTMPFLNLVSQLERLEELYMLERVPKRGVDATLAKTTVTTEHIRKAVLKMHASKLKVLVIRNDCTTDWDFNVKTVMLLCQQASKLEELTASFSNKAMHTLLQFFYGLISLHALHVLIFRTADNCDFSRSELPRLVIDNVSNHPELKLEYFAFIDTVERLVRRKVAMPKSKSKGKEKASAKIKEKLPWDLLHATCANLGIQDTYDWQQSSDDEVETQYGKNGLRIESRPLRPCDVFGVKIFEKEIISGRL